MEGADRPSSSTAAAAVGRWNGEEQEEIASSTLIRDDTWSCVIVLLTFWFFVSVTLILGVYGSVNLQLGPYTSLLIAPSPYFVEYIKVCLYSVCSYSPTMEKRNTEKRRERERKFFKATFVCLMVGWKDPKKMNRNFFRVKNLFKVNIRPRCRADVEQVDDAKPGPNVYGLYAAPKHDVINTWSQSHNTSLPSGYHKVWLYILNEGSHINISYSVNSPTSSSLILIIAEGSEGLAQWLENPSYPNTTLSWNSIHGSGTIQQDILTSASYYVAVGNMNSEEVEVRLNLRIKSFMHNTTGAYYNCAVASGTCKLGVFFSRNVAVLTSPGPEQGTTSDIWEVKLSYGPRWLTYIFGIGAMTLLMLLAFHFLNNFQCSRGDSNRSQFGDTRSERAPLLSQKDDDLSSWGSSYDSVSGDEEDLEEGSLEGKPLKDGEYNNNIRRLCAICFDAPRECFFLPCGHCVACFDCGTRTADVIGKCPICKRNIKKVRKIFTV